MAKRGKNEIKGVQNLIRYAAIFVSCCVSLLVLFDINQPFYYAGVLFLCPFTFAVLSIICSGLYRQVPHNLGVTIILLLFFCRLVISPMFMTLGNYTVTISKNIKENTLYAILLVVYEAVMVFAALSYFVRQEKRVAAKRGDLKTSERVEHVNSRYFWLFLVVIAALLFCIVKTPVLLSGYRTIFESSDESFTHFEDAQLVEAYGTDFISKLALVAGQYLMRLVLILLPAFIIIKLSSKKTKFRRNIAVCVCLIPLFFIGGAIARSLIYIICLFFLVMYQFHAKNGIGKSLIFLAFAGAAVVIWWLFRGGDGNLFEQFSKRFSAYFSGVNVVSGVFNLPKGFEYRLRYFLYDFTSTVPFGNTIFSINHETVQPFFNAYNGSYGQIPTTIGMGYYYLGPIFAPVYSVVFAIVVASAGSKLKRRDYGNPFACIRLLLIVFYFSMGIVMYNIEITMTNFFSLILPLYIIESIAYGKRNKRKGLYGNAERRVGTYDYV